MKRLLIVAATVLASLGAEDALACSCASSGPPCQGTFTADAVFVGTVQSITPIPADGPPLRPDEHRFPKELHIAFEAVTPFRGVKGHAVTVSTASSGPACGYQFKEGERYLVYAHHRSGAPEFVVSLCSRTRLLAEAAEDLQFLQTLSSVRAEHARVYGTVRHLELDLAAERIREVARAAQVLVSVRSGDRTFDVLTDDEGRYDVNVPPGTYEVMVFPPPGFSTKYLQQTVELRESGACHVADFGVRSDSRIKGVLRQASGEAAARAVVEIMAVESLGQDGRVPTRSASSDAAGSYEFTDLSPGRYLVGVDLTRRMNAEIVFPTTFYPGVGDPKTATIVELSAGEQRELGVLTLPAPRRTRRLTGRVVHQDGTPAQGVFVSLQDGEARWRQVAVGIRTESDGSFSFSVHEGLSYIASSSHWDDATRKSAGGSVGPFVVRGEPSLLKIVLSAPR